MKFYDICIFCLVISLLIPLHLYPRESSVQFSVPLAFLTIRFNEKSGILDEVFINYEKKQNEGWAIRGGDDEYIYFAQKKEITHIYKELPFFSADVSDFEASQINKICNSFIATLHIMEKHLETQKWENLSYLDFYMAPFFRGFYYIIYAARCGRNSLPAVTCINENRYDISIPSMKSEQRVKSWYSNPENIIKFRVIIKELIFQIKLWQKEELTNPDRNNPENRYKNKFFKIYTLFITIYFNIPENPNS